MKPFIRILLICALSHLSLGQMRSCYDVDGTLTQDFPCDPGASVSSCCRSGGHCATNLYCVSPQGAKIVGSCTDKQYSDKACPWPLNKARAATNFDHFDYKLNTTTCTDGTICPSQQDPDCCTLKRGKPEINFHNNAAIPSASRDLISYYAAAGYTIINTASSSISFTTTSTNSEQAATATSSSITPDAALATPSPTSSTTPQAADKILASASSKVGAGIGIAIAIVLVIAFIGVLIYRYRRTRSHGGLSCDKLQRPISKDTAIPDEEAEIYAVTEMPHHDRPVEMDSDRSRGVELAEMEAHDRSRRTIIMQR